MLTDVEVGREGNALWVVQEVEGGWLQGRSTSIEEQRRHWEMTHAVDLEGQSFRSYLEKCFQHLLLRIGFPFLVTKNFSSRQVLVGRNFNPRTHKGEAGGSLKLRPARSTELAPESLNYKEAQS